MIAIKAKVENGNLTWLENPPLVNAEVLVVFAAPAKNMRRTKKKMSNEESLRILNKYAGSIDRDFDYEKEKDEYFNEKYGSFN